MIHRQFAQRRRLMAGETVKTVTLTEALIIPACLVKGMWL